MARNFYFIVALMVTFVYLAQSPKVKIAAPRDMPKPMTINELKSILIGQSLKSGCGCG
ncbi:hypothetical protein P3S68_014140 [Capsicum galapagoense]